MAATGLSDDPVMEPLVCSPLSDEDGTDEDVLPPPKRKEFIIRSSTSNSDAEDDEQTCATTLGKSCTTPHSSAKKGSTSKCTQLVRYSGTPTRKTLNRLLWENFARTDPKHVECRHCKAFLKTTDASTTPLHAHLRNKHKIKYSEYLAAKHKQDVAKVDNENAIRTAIVDRERTALQKINSKPKLINQNIRDALSQCKVPAKYAQNSQAQLKADMDITIFLVTTNQPFSLVEEPGFKRFVESMDPRIIVKNKSTYTRSKCPQLLENVKQAVEKILQNDLPFCDGIAFTSDTWTSRSNDPFQSLTLHYVSKEFELKKFTVDCKSFRGRHTSEAIAKLCDEMINSIPGINSSAMKYATTDSGANMLKAMSIANEITDNLKCFDHILNTCVTKALEQNSLREVVGQCKNLATLTHRSSLSQQKIQRSCDENEPKVTYRKIIQPVCTRWNSLHACMDSILAMKSPLLSIKATENGTDLANAIPDECGFKKLEQIIKPLDEIRRASEMLSAEDKPTIHLVLCYMVTLSNLQAKYGYLGKESLELCRSFTDHLNPRVPNKGKNEYIYCAANLLHPRFKGSVMKLDNDQFTFEGTKNRLLREYSLQYGAPTENSISTQDQLTPSESTSGWSELEKLTKEFEAVDNVETTKQSDVQKEMKIFLESTVRADHVEVDVLQWWKKNERVFPCLAKCARRILGIPATSAPSERVFSCSGNIMTSQRHQLASKNLEMLVYIKQNFDKVYIPKWKFDEVGTSKCSLNYA
ncbi:zinc finger BED domain-containing protein 1-like [Aedes aegypti]|uniref:Uncharacterized protein n=1 Tax=Aedes aegypti TaxID=7159 RepID=A0A6I8U4U8_AEDAE|nr:zinc finger BED domain-containing protein 1-like [Aedes aegypti]